MAANFKRPDYELLINSGANLKQLCFKPQLFFTSLIPEGVVPNTCFAHERIRFRQLFWPIIWIFYRLKHEA